MRNSKILNFIKDIYTIFRKSLSHFPDNQPIMLSGTTAFFAIFSIAPVLIIIISVFGYVTGNDVISEKLFNELNVLVGQKSTNLLKNAIDNYQISENSGIGTAIGAVFFLISATTFFSIMQNSINYIWRIKVKPKFKPGILKFLKDRLFSFGVILCMGFVLLVSLVIDASIEFLKGFLTNHFGTDFIILVRLINFALTLAIIMVVFALIYRFLPDVSVQWNASWFGAIFASILFIVGKFIIGIIIGNSSLGAVYGAASSFVIILLWIYYVSLIFYFGVELSRRYSIYYGHNNKPLNFAVPFQISTLTNE